MPVSALILGCSGLVLSGEERAFFRDADPFGFILFRRNIGTPDEVRSLTAALREAVGRDAPDPRRPGGRPRPAARPAALAEIPARTGLWPRPARTIRSTRREIARLGARLIAHDLLDVGINVDCLPVLDVPGRRRARHRRGPRLRQRRRDGRGPWPRRRRGADGRRRAARDQAHAGPWTGGRRQPCLAAGRRCALADLAAIDFLPFRMLADMPMAMTAHVVYTAIDREAPATTSRQAIRRVIRGMIGYDGLLMSDDLSMQALAGGLGERARRGFPAGCDIGLHCNGKMEEMLPVARRRRGLPARRDAAPTRPCRGCAIFRNRSISARRGPGSTRHSPRWSRPDADVRPVRLRARGGQDGLGCRSLRRRRRRFRGPARPAARLGAAAEGRPHQDLDPRAGRAISRFRRGGTPRCASNSPPTTSSWRPGSPISNPACFCPIRPRATSRRPPISPRRSPSG